MDITPRLICYQLGEGRGEDFATRLKELHSTMKEHLEEAQLCYKEFVDVRKKEQLNFQVGNKVWLL